MRERSGLPWAGWPGPWLGRGDAAVGGGQDLGAVNRAGIGVRDLLKLVPMFAWSKLKSREETRLNSGKEFLPWQHTTNA